MAVSRNLPELKRLWKQVSEAPLDSQNEREIYAKIDDLLTLSSPKVNYDYGLFVFCKIYGGTPKDIDAELTTLCESCDISVKMDYLNKNIFERFADRSLDVAVVTIISQEDKNARDTHKERRKKEDMEKNFLIHAPLTSVYH